LGEKGETIDFADSESVLQRIRVQANREALRVTQHAQQEMVEEEILLDDLLEALRSSSGQILENYPEHRRGPCCLLGGYNRAGRPLHVVCTTSRELLIIITVYEPKPPKWITPTRRGITS
jgi:hypothetical protein